jgi:hypothetical protein
MLLSSMGPGCECTVLQVLSAVAVTSYSQEEAFSTG